MSVEDRTVVAIEDVASTLHKVEGFLNNLVNQQKETPLPPTISVQLVKYVVSTVIMRINFTGDLMNTLLSMTLLHKLMC